MYRSVQRNDATCVGLYSSLPCGIIMCVCNKDTALFSIMMTYYGIKMQHTLLSLISNLKNKHNAICSLYKFQFSQSHEKIFLLLFLVITHIVHVTGIFVDFLTTQAIKHEIKYGQKCSQMIN